MSGATVSGIRGYAPGSYGVGAFSKSDCTDFLAAADFTIPDPPPPTATLATTVNPGPSVSLTLTNGPSNWWFRINWWGTCTAVTGTNTVNNIRGYQAGTHSVDAYSDGGCHTKIASSSFTIPELALAIAVDSSDWSVDLTLTGGPTNWWFKIGWWGTCTAATGTTVSNIRGYQSGSYVVAVYPASGCAAGTHVAAESFTIPTATLTATVNSDHSVNLNLSNGPNNWWFRINWWGACTAAPGNTVGNIQGYQAGTHAAAAYSDSGCNYHVASSSFTLPDTPAQPAAPTLTSGNRQLTAAWTAPSSGASAINDYDLRYRAAGTTNWNSATNYTTYFANKLSNGSAGWAIDLGDVSITGLTITKIDQGTNNIRFVYKIDEAVDRLRIALSGNNGQGSPRTYYARYASTQPTTASMATHGTLLWEQTNVAYSANFSGSAWTPALPAGTYFWVAATGGNTSTAQVRPTIQADVIAVPSPLEAVLGGLTNGTTYEVQVRASNQSGPGPWSPSSTMKAGLTLTASAVTATGATLTIGAHTAQWWYQADTGPHATCQGPVAANTSTKNLTGLTAGTTYTYSAYSASGCATANEIASETFTTPVTLTASNVTATGATLTIAGHTGQWWYQADTGPHATCQGPVAANTSTKALTGLTAGTTYAYKAYSDSTCTTANLLASETFTVASLTASNVTTTTATLTLSGPTNWWVKRTSPADTACTVKTAATHSLSSLTAGTTYTYKAYSDSACATEIASETFITSVSLSNLTGGSSGTAVADSSGGESAKFTTGGNAGGYTLESVDVLIASVTNTTGNASGDLTVALHASDSNGKPGTSQATLSAQSGGNPTGQGTYTYTCPDSANCSLSPATEYHVVLSAPNTTGNGKYSWATTDSTSTRVQQPSNNGWSVDLPHYQHSGSWQNVGDPRRTKVTAALEPSLTVSSITSTGATLTLSHYAGAWWYNGSQANASCEPVAAGTTTATLSSLTTGTAHTYKAYSATGCNTADEIAATAAFTPGSAPTLTAGTPTASKNTITIANWSGVWSYKHGNTGAVCTPVAAGTTSVNLTELAVNTTFTYTAYSDGVCSAAIAAASAFTTANPTLTVAWSGPVDNREAVLTLSGWVAGDYRQPNQDGRWYYQYTVPNGGTCSFPRNTQTGLGIDVTVGTSYTFKAYGGLGCNSTEIASLTVVAQGPGVANAAKDISLHSDNADTDGVWTDGTTIWALDSTDDKIYAYTVSTKARDSAKDFTSLSGLGTDIPYGIWSDGTTMWVAAGTKLYAYKMSDKSRDSGKEFDTLFAAQNHQPFGIWSDGTTMWVADYVDDRLYAYKMSDKSRDSGKDITLNSDNDNANGIWSDGVTMWVVDHTDSKAYAYTLSNGNRVSAKDFSLTAGARGLTSDGHHFYVANPSTDKLHAHYAFPALTATTVSFATATVTLTGYVDGNWWIKKTSGTPGSCTAGESDYSHALSSLTPSTSYTYKAYTDSQCQSANELASETFTTAAVPVPGSVGAQVQDISMTTTANNQLQVWWDRPANVTGSIGYTVSCYTNVWKVCHTEAAGTGTSFKVTPSVTGSPTKVRVRATLSGSNSAWVEVNIPSGTVPGAPTAVNSALGHGGYTMSWTKPSSPAGAVGYHTQCRDSNTNWTNCGSAGSNGVIPPTTSTGVSTNVGYIFQFRVRAVVNGLVSAWVVSS